MPTWLCLPSFPPTSSLPLLRLIPAISAASRHIRSLTTPFPVRQKQNPTPPFPNPNPNPNRNPSSSISMASSRRLSNGRSPLVRKQSQITTFFSPGKTPKADPSPKSTPTPIPTPSPNPNPSPISGADPSPSQTKQKKPPLFIPPSPASNPRTTPTAGKKAFSSEPEVVGRRIRVFWPLDKAWYEGRVKSFDAASGKHLIQYDDAEEESIDLANEKIEWVEEEHPRGLRRLRRMSDSGTAASKMVEEEESSGAHSTDDEEWGGGIGKDAVEDDSEEVELEEEVEETVSSRRSQASSSGGSRKRKKIKVETLNSIKKIKLNESEEKNEAEIPPSKGKNSFIGTVTNADRGQTLDTFDSTLTGDAEERFGKREAEKFRFLGSGRKDAHGRCPGDADYDPRTLFLPQDFLRSLSGGQRQWWEFKSKHMDKVLFFKMGKFYELFEMDAHIGARELDLQYMKGEQPHCGFPEKNFSMNLEKLARKGYRVLVVEQTETPEQLELRRKEMGSKDKVVKREICAMVTKGTLTEGELLSTNPDASFLMSITENCQSFENRKNSNIVIGVCVVDVSTSKFMVGQFEDDSERQCLCSILAELRPVEIVKPSKVLSSETEKVIKNHTRNPLVNDLVPSLEFWDAEKTIGEIRSYYQLSSHSPISGLSNDAYGDISANFGNVEKGSGTLPDVLFELVSAGQSRYCALSALGGCLFYLRQAFLDESLLKCAKFEPLPCSGFLNNLQKPYMILDAAALENLEILENNRNGSPSGSLFAQLDHCMTSFGKRLLKGWLARPLYELGPILERQDAIAVFKGVGLASALEFRKELSKLPDMERLLARLFSSCDANGRNANRVILYEDAAKKQLKEFIAALSGCQVMIQACSSLNTVLDRTKSGLLHHLLTLGKGLPDVYPVLKFFKDAFYWSEADRSGRIIPHEGGDIEYDTACSIVKEIESGLTRHLKDQHKLLADASINYVTVGKEAYLLEVPESLSSAVPRDYELRSSRKGYFRYWTPEIKKYLSELSQAEAEKESKLKSILQRFILHFSEHHSKWRQLVSVTAELDVLISLAIASDYYEGPTCCPVVKERCQSGDTVPSLSARSLGHPVLRSDALGKSSFVPNDVIIGGAGHASFILLTGPNMGGKSTLLRQVCMAVILAQIGADVPAESFELSLVDRIFVRMGARDHIMAGQSTFLMELSETASMLSSATRNSLVALDELGRGTSTSDGQAIAGSVLEYFVHEIQCRGLFSTHYHRLAVEYEKDTMVSLCHMACQVGRGIEGVEEVTFLYRLTPGSCPKSYGVNVARLAGIPASILQKARAKSNAFETIYGSCRHGFEGKQMKHISDDEIAVLQEVLRAAEAWNRHEDVNAINLGFLRAIQQRVKLLAA